MFTGVTNYGIFSGNHSAQRLPNSSMNPLAVVIVLSEFVFVFIHTSAEDVSTD